MHKEFMSSVNDSSVQRKASEIDCRRSLDIDINVKQEFDVLTSMIKRRCVSSLKSIFDCGYAVIVYLFE